MLMQRDEESLELTFFFRWRNERFTSKSNTRKVVEDKLLETAATCYVWHSNNDIELLKRVFMLGLEFAYEKLISKLKWLAKTKREKRNDFLIYCFVSGMIIESLTQLSKFVLCNSMWSVLKEVSSPSFSCDFFRKLTRHTAHRFYSEHNRTLMLIPRKWTNNNLRLIMSCSAET